MSCIVTSFDKTLRNLQLGSRSRPALALSRLGMLVGVVLGAESFGSSAPVPSGSGSCSGVGDVVFAAKTFFCS